MPQTKIPPPPGFVPESQIPPPPPGFVPEQQTQQTQQATPTPDYWGDYKAGKYPPTEKKDEFTVSSVIDRIKSGKIKTAFDPTAVSLPGQEGVNPEGVGAGDLFSFKYWGRALKPEFWKNAAANLFTGVGGQLVEPTSPVGIINSVKTRAEQAGSPEGMPTDKQEIKSAVEQAVSFFPPIFIGKTVAGMATDPLGTFERDPFAVLIVASGFSGEAKNLLAKRKAGKPIVPKDMRKIIPDLKKWSMKATEDAGLVDRTIKSANEAMARRAEAQKITGQPEAMGPEIPDAFGPIGGRDVYATGLGPRMVNGPDIPEEAPFIAARQRAVPVGPVEGVKVAEQPSVPEFGRLEPPRPAEAHVKGPWVEWKEAFAGMPIDDKVFNYLKEGKLFAGISRDPATGQETKIPTKVVSKGDYKTDIPNYTARPSVASSEPFVVEKNAGGMPTGMAGYKHEREALQAIKDIEPTKYKYMLENPIRWFDNAPFLKESLYYPWRSAENATQFEKHSTKMQVAVWEKSVPRSMQKDLGDYAIAKQKNGPESLQLMGIDPADVVARVESNPAMMKIYNEARVGLERMFVRINQARELEGLPPLPKVENYFTFARGVNELDAIGHPVIQEKNPDMLKRHLYEPTFSYKKRENVIAPMNRRFYGIYEHYMNNSARYTNYAPVVAKGRVLLGDWGLKDTQGRDSGSFRLDGTAPNLARMTNEWVDRIAGKHTDAHPAFSKALSAIARNTGSAVIAFNPRSAILQPTSLQNTYIEIGGKWLAKGVEEYAVRDRRQFAMRNSEVLTGRAMDVNLEDLWADGVARIISRGRSKASEVGSYPLRVLDGMAARMSWLGAYERAIAPEAKGGLGLMGKDAIRYADDVVVRTQASAKVGDLARIQTTPIGKMASIFQTFVINNWNYWSKDVMGWKNPEMANADRVKKVTKLILSSLVINTLFEDVIGINSPLPAPERELVKGIREGKSFQETLVNMAKEVSESVPIVGGSIKYTNRYRESLPQGAQQIKDVTRLGADIMESFAKWDLSKMSNQDLQTLSKFFGVPGSAELFKIQKQTKAGMPWYKILLGARTPTKAEADKIKTGEMIR